MALKGSTPWNKGKTGFRHSAETRQKISQNNAKHWLGKTRTSLLGHPKWNFTEWDHKAVMTDEVKQKISQTKTGVPLSPDTRAKILATVKRGSDNPRWRGNRTERQTAHNRAEYKQWRSAVFARDNFTCQMCDQYSGYLHADHIKTWAEYPELRYDVKNGRTLCRACHFYITFKRNMNPTSLWGLTKQEK